MSLHCNHEKTNTDLLLDAKASCDEGNDSIVFVCKDTKVFILAKSHRRVTKKPEHFTL